MNSSKPHIVLVVPRGEAVRNFLYSDTLPALADGASVTILSIVDDKELLAGAQKHVQEIIPLRHYPPAKWVSRLRTLTENAHDRWLWSEVAKNNWELRDRRAREQRKSFQRFLVKLAARSMAWRPLLEAMTKAEQATSLRTSDTSEFERIFDRVRPDLVFNCSHIHGIAGELPLKVAAQKKITTAGFIFSWDNLTSRSRIFVPYDHWLVWHDGMKRQLLKIYPRIPANKVHVTGTPQFDFHFKPEFDLGREELCRRIAVDPSRPFILYTAGIAHHFFEEHRHVEIVIDSLRELDLPDKPQLVVRTNIKDTSPEMDELAASGHQDVVFPRASWDKESLTPREDDLALYSSLVRHCALGINAASTVSLELMMLDKPVINLDFDPPGSDLPWCLGYERHIRFDHYQPVAGCGAVMVARSSSDVRWMLGGVFEATEKGRRVRRRFLEKFFGTLPDGTSGEKVAATLLSLAQGSA